jgi:hypothetical protein
MRWDEFSAELENQAERLLAILSTESELQKIRSMMFST